MKNHSMPCKTGKFAGFWQTFLPDGQTHHLLVTVRGTCRHSTGNSDRNFCLMCCEHERGKQEVLWNWNFFWNNSRGKMWQPAHDVQDIHCEARIANKICLVNPSCVQITICSSKNACVVIVPQTAPTPCTACLHVRAKWPFSSPLHCLPVHLGPGDDPTPRYPSVCSLPVHLGSWSVSPPHLGQMNSPPPHTDCL